MRPQYPEALSNLGNALCDQGRADEAVACYEQAVALKPDYAEAHNNLGNALTEQGRLEEAIAHYEQALAVKADYPAALSNLGNVFLAQGELSRAIALYERALIIEPDHHSALSNLGQAFQIRGELDEAVACYERVLAIRPEAASMRSNLLLVRASHISFDPASYLAAAAQWDVHYERFDANRSTAQLRRDPLVGRRLRIGYVSGDYLDHAVSHFIERLFAHHDRARVELFAYATAAKSDAVTERLRGLIDHWVSLVGLPDTAARERIVSDGIDVLVDLSGHTAHNRLGVFALRSAPVQVHYLGFFASTGLSQMDYWIGDAVLTPPETDGHFREQVWRLPRVWVTYDAESAAPEPGWHPSVDGTVWLGSFNRMAKLTPQTIALWSRVLRELPEGRLLLKTKEFADAANRHRLLEAFASHGIEADRIALMDRGTTLDWPGQMSLYDRVDIALDPVGGVGGGTTTCDALWMGVPVITLAGDRMATRMTASMLTAIGRPEWIARDEAEYVAKVVALARDVDRRTALRSEQRARMAASPLCDAPGLARALEAAFAAMVERERGVPR
jgi:predicted O-linked N-acetylglucosamine transferase (SPINDLY family)